MTGIEEAALIAAIASEAGGAAAGAGGAGALGAGLGAGLGAEAIPALAMGAEGAGAGAAGGLIPELMAAPEAVSGAGVSSGGLFDPSGLNIGAPGMQDWASGAAPTSASTPSSGGGFFQGLSDMLPKNIFPQGKSTVENALMTSAVGNMLGGLFGGGGKSQVGASPLPHAIREGGGYRPTVQAQLEALQQMALASRRPKQGGFF